ncbi:hypothetical protein Tco_1301178 [Tanacetum coccineum]
MHHLQQMQDKAKDSCMVSFQLLHSHLTALLNNDLKGTSIEGGFEWGFATLFEQDVQTFTRIMFVNLDHLEKHLSKEEFQELESSSAFRHMESLRESIQESAKHKREYDKRMNDRMMQSKEGNVDSSKALDAGLIHSKQCESVYDTYLLKKVDRNTIPKSTDMSHRGEIDRNADAEKCHVSFTPYYLPKVRDYELVKPHHVIAPGSSRNSQEESYDSNDIAHNHYLKEARKKTQERNRNSKSIVIHTTSLQNTTNGSKQKPRSNNQTSKSLHVSKSSGVTSNSVPLVDHSRNSSSFSDSKHFVQSPKTRNNIKPVEKINNVIKPKSWISKGYRISPNKSSVVHEKPNTPRFCFRWKPTGRIFKTAGLRWIPTGKKFISSTTKVDCEPPNGSYEDITNPYECNQTLNVSADNTSGPVPQRKQRCTLQCALSSKEEKSSSGNPVKEILLNLSLPDHRLIITDSKIHLKMDKEVPDSSRLTDS